jgi:hypothetical protein
MLFKWGSNFLFLEFQNTCVLFFSGSWGKRWRGRGRKELHEEEDSSKRV